MIVPFISIVHKCGPHLQDLNSTLYKHNHTQNDVKQIFLIFFLMTIFLYMYRMMTTLRETMNKIIKLSKSHRVNQIKNQPKLYLKI